MNIVCTLTSRRFAQAAWRSQSIQTLRDSLSAQHAFSLMWLINATTLRLEDFHLREVPPYAILSHTWGDHEVNFKDMVSLAPIRLLKRGYLKILQACRLAKERCLDYAWIDTCCIDKTSSAELTESINSMFNYYEQAVVCFAHLVDLPRGSKDLTSCRWFTRGWTLQELLAPKALEFYNAAWESIGSKADFVDAISSITNVPTNALDEPWGAQDFSIAARMSWASKRQTTRIEDNAYCLLGIFDVNMPLIYGEGHKAFQRLQEEIVKRDADLTIFAWSSSKQTEWPGVNLLAPSPDVYCDSGSVMQASFIDVLGVNFALANYFLQLNHPIYEIPVPTDNRKKVLGVRVGEVVGASGHLQAAMIPLRLISPALLCRHKDFPLTFEFPSRLRQWQYQYEGLPFQRIVTYNIERSLGMFSQYREDAIRVSLPHGVGLIKVFPEQIWDPEDGMLLRSRTSDDRPEVIAMSFKIEHHDEGGTDAPTHTNWLVSCQLDTEPLRAGIIVARPWSNMFALTRKMFDVKEFRQKLDYSRTDEIISVLNGQLTITASKLCLNSRTAFHGGKIVTLSDESMHA